MDYQHFITMIKERAHVPEEDPERLACTTLHTLAQRISKGEAEDLAVRLPEQLQRCIEHEGPREQFDVDEFIQRIAETLGVDRSTAEQNARAVLAALWRAVGPKEFDDMRSELPKDFGPLLDDAVGAS
jgi:uncharacterized protein (DUF2267 family)